MVSHANCETLKGKRDRALLLFGFASAMRRSELVGLQMDDIEDTDRGLLVTLRRSKTDQEGDEKATALPYLGTLINTTICLCRIIDHSVSAFSNGSVLRSVSYVG